MGIVDDAIAGRLQMLVFLMRFTEPAKLMKEKLQAEASGSPISRLRLGVRQPAQKATPTAGGSLIDFIGERRQPQDEAAPSIDEFIAQGRNLQ